MVTLSFLQNANTIYFEDLAVSNSSTNAKASLIFDEVTKLKESNIMVAANCILFLR